MQNGIVLLSGILEPTVSLNQFRTPHHIAGLEIMENLENHETKFHAWNNHGLEFEKNPE